MTAADALLTPNASRTAQGRLAGEPLLLVEELRVRFDPRRRPPITAVNGVSFQVRRGTVVGLIGESGSGKSMTANAILRLIPKPGQITGGRIQFRDQTCFRWTRPACERSAANRSQ